MATTVDDRAVTTVARTRAADELDGPGRAAWPVVVALGIAATLIVVTSRFGEAMLADHVRLKLHTPPLRGVTDWHPGPGALAAVVVSILGVVGLPWAARRMRWSSLLLLAFGVALAWSVALALVDGREALTAPLLPQQYLRTVPRVGDPVEFLRTFVDRLPDYNIHTQGHPPGMVMLLWVMDRIGLGGTAWNATLVLSGGAAGVVVTLAGVREVAGEQLARAAMPLLVLAPAAIWWSSADALFTGVSAAAIVLLLFATGRSGRRSDRLAMASGAAFAGTALLSYGLVLLAMVPIAVAWSRRRLRPVVIAAVSAAVCILAVAALSGFAWWDGLLATRDRYFAGVARNRPYEYFLFGNLAVFALMIGPAAVAGLTRVRRTPLAWLVGGGVAAVVLADLSGMSKAEVERIWLPFVPWVLVAGAVMTAARPRAARAWLAAQLLMTLTVATAIRSPW